jgi:hypothetical protein
VWAVNYVHAAKLELREWPDAEQTAVNNAVEKLKALGTRLPEPHCKSVEGSDGLWELRPRGGNSPVRPIYKRTGAEEFTIAAVAPDGQTNRREFGQACERAAERLASRERNR